MPEKPLSKFTIVRRWLTTRWLELLGFSLERTEIAPDEPLSRFITAKRATKKNKPVAAAFLPRLNGTWGTSVYRSLGVSRGRLQRIGELVGALSQEHTLCGRALITQDKIASVRENVPAVKNDLILKSGRFPSLHRDISGWPNGSLDEEKKGLRKLLAEYLAAESDFEPYPWA